MKLKLVKKTLEARGTKTFYWEPENKIDYLPGQYYYFTLPVLKFPDSRGTTRHFSISTSPSEGEIISFTTRIREESGYKKTLDTLKIGEIIEGEGPSGTFIFDEKEAEASNNKPQVFIAGGIGIAPFRSIFKYIFDKGIVNPIYLIYSNSDNEFVFKKDLDKWSKEAENINVEYYDSSKSGHINDIKIKEIFEKWGLSTNNLNIWLVGPPQFNEATAKALSTLKIPDGMIRSEKFTGY